MVKLSKHPRNRRRRRNRSKNRVLRNSERSFERYQRSHDRLKQLIGVRASTTGTSQTVHDLTAANVSYWEANYWKRKVEDPHFHPNTHGGRRWSKWTPWQYYLLQVVLWIIVRLLPLYGVYEYSIIMSGFFVCFVTYWDVYRIFKKWGFSPKLPIYQNLAKFTPENMRRYFNYVLWLRTVPIERIKYTDEVYFDHRHMKRCKVWTRTGWKRLLAKRFNLTERMTGTLLSSVTGLFFQMKRGTNTAVDFFGYIMKALQEGFLRYGDFLVMDNAPIHMRADVLILLVYILSYCGIRVVFLPTYSPELNPCELVFNTLKNRLSRAFTVPNLEREIRRRLAQVSRGEMMGYYEKCTVLKKILESLGGRVRGFVQKLEIKMKNI